uniref:Zinc finger, CCHC-type n=1 Tax=Caenorhabditis tropicalis TaxID=1561998 RepID=A0A1I7U523_9PELO
MILMMYMQHGFRRDLRWLQFAQWKLQQLAERLRYQEPNVALLEQITRRVNERKNTESAFDFFNKNRDANNNVAGINDQNKMTNSGKGANRGTDLVAEQVKKAKAEDAEKVLRDTNIDANTPMIQKPQQKSGGSQKIFKKWTDATKDILAIDDNNDDEKGKLLVDRTQEE